MIEHFVDEHGIVLRRDLLALGVSDKVLYREAKAKRLVRLRQGAYVLAEVFAKAGRRERHRLLCLAVMRLYDDDVALSHVSACLAHGGPDWGLDLTDAHLTNLYGRGERNGARVRHHRGACRVDDVTRRGGHWVTAPARTALDTAATTDRDAAVCVLDWFLNQGLVVPDQYWQVFDAQREWPDSLSLHRKLELVDGRSESVGETRTRLLCLDHGLPAPVPQYEVFHPSGRLAGRVDFAWPKHRVMLEFDGKAKYLALRAPGQSIEDVVLAEKQREDLLRRLTGWMMLRIVWADLERARQTAAMLERALAGR